MTHRSHGQRLGIAPIQKLRLRKAIAGSVESLETRRLFATVVVNTTADVPTANDGAVTLREAINAINAGSNLGDADITAQTVGTFGTFDIIQFEIPGSGVKTIKPAAGGLPAITKPVSINGFSQPGALANTLAVGNNAKPLIELDGTNGGGGLFFFTGSSGSVVRGLIINRFSGHGIQMSDSSGNTIGGNFIGTDPTGTIALGNKNGVFLNNGADNNNVGGSALYDHNLISGNQEVGVFILTKGNTVRGNQIGTNAAGTGDFGNKGDGVDLVGASNNTIGGAAAGEGNVISGNDQKGIFVYGGDNANTVIQGNYIGTNAAGTAALGNTLEGIQIQATPGQVKVGGTAATAGNVISGNGSSGLYLLTTSSSIVQGNRIGTNAAGTAAVPNLGAAGLLVGAFSTGIRIGGADSGAGNIISGNANIGLDIEATSANSNTVQGNYIGTNSALANLGNGHEGVRLSGAVQSNLIGGLNPGEGNAIAFNGSAGVSVNDTASQNPILSNSIFSNTGLGIDQGSNGVTQAPDNGDIDTGPNDLQNIPVLTTALAGGATTTVAGSYSSTPNTNIYLQFFVSTQQDPTGFGEGATRVLTQSIFTGPTGVIPINAVLPLAVTAGSFVTATATVFTPAQGNVPAVLRSTSEFSNAVTVTLAPASSGSVSLVTDPCDQSKKAVKIEGTNDADTIVVTKVGSSQGKVNVTINGFDKGTFSFSGSILVYGEDGNDNISVQSSITRSVFAFGGDGKDTVSGGGGNDVLLGEDGDDVVKGNAGRDLLIGGERVDKLDGGSGDDILVAGETNHDGSISRLCKLLDEWERTDKSYSSRVSHIVNGGGLNGSVKLNAKTTYSSPYVKDTLTGGSNTDLFYAAVPGDRLTDKANGETVIDDG